MGAPPTTAGAAVGGGDGTAAGAPGGGVARPARGFTRFARGARDLPAAIDAALRFCAWAPVVARCGPCVLPNVKASKAGSSNGMP